MRYGKSKGRSYGHRRRSFKKHGRHGRGTKRLKTYYVSRGGIRL